MISIDADHLDHKALNDRLRGIKAPVQLTNCCGQRFIAAGMAPVSLSITGVPGNALGAYLNGGKIVVHGNAQDAVGDTMNDGTIIVHGSIGDAAGYAMRGGKIYVKGNAGYRAGIHIKAYEDKSPTMIIGGTCGSFLGEYQAGGTIIVPTYVSLTDGANSPIPRLLSRLGVRFQEHFTPASYRAFFERMGCMDVTYRVVRGRIPCVIASFTNDQ